MRVFIFASMEPSSPHPRANSDAGWRDIGSEAGARGLGPLPIQVRSSFRCGLYFGEYLRLIVGGGPMTNTYIKLLADCLKEHFCVVLLSVKHEVIGVHVVSVGTLNGSLVHPREVFLPAIKLAAHSVILCHNHPSGDPEPSRQDKQITRRIVQAGELLAIQVLDHVIVGQDAHYSMADEGELK